MSKYTENSAIIPFSMFCPGISQNTKHHHLTLYRGQVWEKKSYIELCNNNVLNIAFDPSSLFGGTMAALFDSSLGSGDVMEQNGELYVPPIPRWHNNKLFNLFDPMIPWDSEILQSFTKGT